MAQPFGAEKFRRITVRFADLFQPDIRTTSRTCISSLDATSQFPSCLPAVACLSFDSSNLFDLQWLNAREVWMTPPLNQDYKPYSPVHKNQHPQALAMQPDNQAAYTLLGLGLFF